MPWPIPKLINTDRPKALPLRAWLPALTATALGIAGAVLLLWPHGKPTQGFQFWALFVGAPLVTCALVSGIRLDRWEREQTIAEETEREQARIMSLWHEWCRRHIRVMAALAILPITLRTDELSDADIDLPVNTERAKSLQLPNEEAASCRREELLGRIVGGLHTALVDRRSMPVRLLLDDASLALSDAWKNAAVNAFARIMPGGHFNIEIEHAAGCAQWLEQQIERDAATPLLIIAAQLWPDGESEHSFSESAAALLIDPAAEQAGYIFRPMISNRDMVEADLAQLMEMQVEPDSPTHVWFTGCDDESVLITSALSPDPKVPVIERNLDAIVGKPGSASSWIALAAAFESAQGSQPHLVAWRELNEEPLNLCMIAPAQLRPSHEEIQS